MQKLKIGIIGLNFGLNCHLPSFKKNKKCKVIALCSTNLNKAKIAAARAGTASSLITHSIISCASSKLSASDTSNFCSSSFIFLNQHFICSSFSTQTNASIANISCCSLRVRKGLNSTNLYLTSVDITRLRKH